MRTTCLSLTESLCDSLAESHTDPNGINDLTPNPTVSHGCATVGHCWATVAGCRVTGADHLEDVREMAGGKALETGARWLHRGYMAAGKEKRARA